MERHVIEAALVTVRPNSSPEARSHASASLESWTRSERASTDGSSSNSTDQNISTWETYARLLRLFFDNNNNNNSSNNGNGNDADHVEKIAMETSSSSTTTIKSEAMGAKLLILTMLHAKVRRDFRALVSHRPDVAVAIRDEIGMSLTRLGQKISGDDGHGGDAGLVAPLCSSAAAVAVRLGGRDNSGGTGADVSELVEAARSSIVAPPSGSAGASTLVPSIALAVLSCLPEEAQASDLSGTEVDNVLRLSVSQALEATYVSLVRSLSGGPGNSTNAIPTSLKALEHWCGPCHVTLSQLNVPPAIDTGIAAGDQPSFLALLVRILSESNPPSEEIIKAASKALTEAIVQSSDVGTATRVEAIRMLFSAIPAHGFLAAPLAYCSSNELDDASHSLACLASDLATEEVETIASCQVPGCAEIIEILLRLQSHPFQPVAISTLEFWLALQDIPTSDRHPSLAAPLFGQLVDGLVNRVSYPPTFTTWENEFDLDRQEFDEIRRLVVDVLVSGYFLLRCGYLERLASVIQSSHSDQNGWASTESALFCLCSVSREVCARVKARGVGTVAADRDATARGLVQLVQILCHGGAEAAARRHPLVLTRSASFVGSYAPVWNVCCSAEDILELLRYLIAAMGSGPDASEAAAKSTKLVLIGCSSKLLPAASAVSDPNSNPVTAVMSAAIETSLATNHIQSLTWVAEGCTRLSVQIKDTDAIRQFLSTIVSPMIRISQQALGVVHSSSSAVSDGGEVARVEAACQTLASCLCGLREVVRFCERPPSQESANSGTSTWHPLADIMSAIWPLLNDVASSHVCRAHEDVLSRLLDLHGQLLASAPDLVAPYFSQLITFVVQAYEETHLPCTLDYVGDAVELFGGKADEGAEVSFNQLLAHISQRTYVYVTQEKRPNECPQVIRALFDMARRYLLFCPGALSKCPEFSSLFAFAVACLKECKGERDSTRATLNFLSQLIGWRTLRLSTASQAALEASTSAIDAAIVQHGETLTRACIEGLSGGGPQMLWPAYSECFFAVIVNAIRTNNGTAGQMNGHGAQNTFAHQWIYLALSDDTLLGNVPSLTAEVRTSILQLLCGLVLRDGPKSKPRVKMLLSDFGKICKGDATPDALIAYSLS